MAAVEEVYSDGATAETDSAAVSDPPPSGVLPVGKHGSSGSDTGAESDVIDPDLNSSNSDIQMKDLVKFLSKLKLNPQAKEFVPSCYFYSPMGGAYYFLLPEKNSVHHTSPDQMKKSNNTGKKRKNHRASRGQKEENIKRTVYISDVESNITEERLAEVFGSCGQINDCRVCGDPRSRLRFAFVEFADEGSAKTSLKLSGLTLGSTAIKVLPSKTAILPVNPTFLPKSEDERQMCARTVYCTNIDRKVSEDEVKSFFERKCGKVSQLRLLADYSLMTKIAFVELAEFESALSALDCCGEMLGSRRIRISPSKTPVRPMTSSPGA